MEVALGSANWLLGKVLNKLSGDLVAGYVASSELGLNFNKIKTDLNFTLGLLHAAQGRDVSNNPGLQRLLEDLNNKADEAEDALDELEYFMIQDELDGTREAAPDLGDGLSAQALHARHAARNTVGNWLSYFSCCNSQDAVAAAVTNNTKVTNKAKSDSMNIDGGCGDKLPFDRVAMSNKIKQLIEDMHSICSPVSDLLKIYSSTTPQPNMFAPTMRSHTSSEITQQKLFGRDIIFEQTISEMVNATHKGEILSILPIVGPGGIGKTTFTQHLYNDKRTEDHFAVRVWVCVSTSFDVLKLTKEILSCLPAIKNNEENEIGNGTTTNNLDQLQKSIAMRLKSIRFLIVLDDIWECSGNDEWEKLLAPFDKGEVNGSMVLVTTRFPKIVQLVKRETHPICLNGLEPNEFWKFFQLCVFGRVQDEHDKEDLIEIARKISAKLKCSPLAAKTVGRLLSKKPSLGHWMEILEKEEWLKQEHSNDIIPALKISYDYLPFHLRKCFSYCSLYPEDYRFHSSEISRFWSSIGITDTSGQIDKIEHIGSNYLDELVDSGFLMKENYYYVMHDLLHELSQSVSSKECAYINCSNFRANDFPSSIRHVSIHMKRNSTQSFEQELDKLKTRIDTGNLRSLMFFGDYKIERTVNILKHTFKDIKSLRVLFIFMNSLDSLPHNFSKLVHLRYLKISSCFKSEVCLPTTISSFYHLKFLELRGCSHTIFPKNIARLCNLHYFLSDSIFHSNVPEVGKMKHLQELKKFCVKKESVGFELTQLGSLTELGGELSICNLEKVKTEEEAREARLIEKRNLNKLSLIWDKEQQYLGANDVLDGFQPHSNLRSLFIKNPPGSIGPSWLCENICIRNLESLHLEGLSWITLPPFGQIPHLRVLKLKSIVGLSRLSLDFSCGFTETSAAPLKSILLHDMPDLVEWVGDENCLLFPLLERVECVDCPVLSALPILGCPRPSTQDLNTPNLQSLHIIDCPNLSLPPMPHTSSLRNICLDNQTVGNFTEELYLRQTCLSIYGYKGDLAIHRLGHVEKINFTDAPQVSLVDLQGLNSLRSLFLCRCTETFYRELNDTVVLHSVEKLTLKEFSLTSKLLSNLFKCFPALSDLSFTDSNEEKEEVVLQLPSSCSLRKFNAHWCQNLLLPSVEDEGALMDLTSLQVFKARSCGRIFSRWSVKEPTQIINPFPASLKELRIEKETSMQSMGLLSNLTSLTDLMVVDCDRLKIDGFNPLIVCNLKRLRITDCGSVAADLLSGVARTKTLPAGAFQLEDLAVDSISAVLVAPICSRLTATLNELRFFDDNQTEGFTKEQEQALQLLHSLQILGLCGCEDVRSLPEGLHYLLSLRELRIYDCPKLRSLPKKTLPASLEEVRVRGCSIEFETELQETGLPIFKFR